jgi:hypothetical protein
VQCAAHLFSKGCNSIPTTRGVDGGLKSEGMSKCIKSMSLLDVTMKKS